MPPIQNIKFLNGVDVTLLDRKLIQKLVLVQSYSGLILEITSGFRTPQKDKAVGGSGSGSHTRGLAVDILCTDSKQAFTLLNAIIQAGFVRFGYEAQHFHVDIDTSLSQNVFWRV